MQVENYIAYLLITLVTYADEPKINFLKKHQTMTIENVGLNKAILQVVS